MAPTFITAAVILWIFNHLDHPLRSTLAKMTGYDIPGAGLVMTILIILLTGAIASTFALRGAIQLFEKTLDRIPLVRTLYSGVKQLVAPLGDEHATFQKVVMVDFPDADTYSLGFLIKPDAGLSPKGELLSAVLVPTNHLHLGNVILVASSRIYAVDLNAEEGLKFLVSMGAALDRQLVLTKPS